MSAHLCTISDLHSSGFDTLVTTDITKSAAMQRTGRAGREGHGYCFRLYTEEAFNSMAMSAEPEIQRSNLTAVFLMLKVIGQDLDKMPFMDRPDQDSSMLPSHLSLISFHILLRSRFGVTDTLAPRRYRQLPLSDRLRTVTRNVPRRANVRSITSHLRETSVHIRGHIHYFFAVVVCSSFPRYYVRARRS